MVGDCVGCGAAAGLEPGIPGEGPLVQEERMPGEGPGCRGTGGHRGTPGLGLPPVACQDHQTCWDLLPPCMPGRGAILTRGHIPSVKAAFCLDAAVQSNCQVSFAEGGFLGAEPPPVDEWALLHTQRPLGAHGTTCPGWGRSDATLQTRMEAL